MASIIKHGMLLSGAVLSGTLSCASPKPLELPAQDSLLIDFDAALDVTHSGTGTNATAWVDQASGITATSASGKEPTYIESGGLGFPCIRTDGTDLMTLSAAVRESAGPATIMMVLDDTAPSRTAFRYLMGQATPSLWLLEQTDSTGNVAYYSAGGHRSTGLSLAGNQILTWAMETGSVSVYRDRQMIDTQDTYTEVALSGAVQLFGYSGVASGYADVYRILVWDKVLSQTELDQAWEFINSVYAVAPELPGQSTMHSSARFTGPTNVSSVRKRWNVTSDFQSTAQNVDILLPASWTPDTARRWPVLFALPPYAGPQTSTYDAIAYIAATGFQDDRDCIVVMPEYSIDPWYYDHASDAQKACERWFREVIMPFVEANYMAGTEYQGRSLIGYSKSGVGAQSLLARRPTEFGYAVSWDSPLMLQTGTDWTEDDYSQQAAFGTEAAWGAYLPRYNISALGTGYDRVILLGDDTGVGTFFGPQPGTPERYLGTEHTAGYAGICDAADYYLDNTQDYAHASAWSTAWVSAAISALVTAKNAGDAADPPADSNLELGTP